MRAGRLGSEFLKCAAQGLHFGLKSSEKRRYRLKFAYAAALLHGECRGHDLFRIEIRRKASQAVGGMLNRRTVADKQSGADCVHKSR